MVSLGWDGDWEIVVVVIVTKGYERERSTQHRVQQQDSSDKITKSYTSK